MGRSGERENKRWAGWGGPQRGLKAAAPGLWAAGSKLQLPGSGPRAPQLQLPGSGPRARWLGHLAKLPHGIRDLPGPGIKPVSPALAGRFFTTEPPGKPTFCRF